MRSFFTQSWSPLVLGALLGLSTVLASCGESALETGVFFELRDGSYTWRTDSSADEECDPEDVADLIEAMEALSDWEFDDDADTDHPKYCDIIREHYAAYQKYLELELDKLIFAEITIKIVNEKHPDGYAAYTENHADGSSTITYYNPNK